MIHFHMLWKMEKGNTKKTHCALCLVSKIMFHCNLCNVSLYKTLKDKLHRFQSCFMIWHNKVDLIMEHNKMKLVYASRIAVRGRGESQNGGEQMHVLRG